MESILVVDQIDHGRRQSSFRPDSAANPARDGDGFLGDGGLRCLLGAVPHPSAAARLQVAGLRWERLCAASVGGLAVGSAEYGR